MTETLKIVEALVKIERLSKQTRSAKLKRVLAAVTCADPSCHRFRFLRSHVGLDRFEKVKRFGLEFDLVPDDRPVMIAQRAQRQRMRLDREHRAILAELLELKSSATTVA